MKHLIPLLVILMFIGCDKGKNANLFYKVGNNSYIAEKYQEAIKNYDMAISYDENFIDAYIWRSRAYLQLDNYENAMKDIDYAINLDKNNPFAIVTKGFIYHNMGDFNNALIYFNKTLEIDPDNENAKRGIQAANFLINLENENRILESGGILKNRYEEITSLFDYLLWNKNNNYMKKQFKVEVYYVSQNGLELEFRDSEGNNLQFTINKRWPEMQRNQRVIIYFSAKGNGMVNAYYSMGDRIIDDIEYY